jgi:hypothetical protein
MTKKAKRPATVLEPPLPAHLPMIPEGIMLTPSSLAALAREVAMDIKVLPDILKHYKLTEETYIDICKVPFYKRALEVATIEWNSALSTHERLRIEAAASLEDALPGLSARMNNKDETLPAATEVGKLFAKIAGIGEPERGGAAATEKFTITINLGADKKLEFTKDVTPVIPIIDQEPSK